MGSKSAYFTIEASREGAITMGIRGDSNKFLQSIDAMVKTLCPGAVSLHVSRIDTPLGHPHKSIYEADRDYFRITKRRAFIRESHCGEFDYSPSSGLTMEQYPALNLQNAEMPGEFLKSFASLIPRLWVLVSDLGEGTHQVTAVYRGNPLWEVVDRDGRDTANLKTEEELRDALARIQACEGLDLKAWADFCKQYWDASVLDAAETPPNCGVTN
jgi:hypothetical protein